MACKYACVCSGNCLNCSRYEKEEVKEQAEKKYLIVEVCNPKCPFMTDEIDNFCLLEKEEEMVLCKFENCPHGKTLEELVAKISKEKELCRIDVNTVVSAILEEK